ncbi:TlpA family protein disulfide reductase [Saccharicrinis sp. GN24d3]|uniref:TlpA family protein disulfide reductase n=1 Tax=Saccharicrinis sp. GN24d3 TaxID=3458416 RepID=UPI0040373A3A
MKLRHIIASAILLVSISCGKTKTEETGYVSAKIQGHVSGFDKPIGFWVNGINTQLDLDGNGNFAFQHDSIAEGTYTLSFGNEESLAVYLKQGTNLVLDIDVNKIKGRDKKAVSITGENVEETQLLYELKVNAPSYQYDRVAYKEVYLPKVDKKNPTEFEAYQLELMEKERAIVKKYVDNKEIREAFLEVYNVELLLNYNFKFKLYERNVKRFNPDKDWKVPAKFKAYFKDEIPQNDFDLYHKSSRYAMYIREGYYNEMHSVLSKYQRESMEYFKAEIAYLDTCSFPVLIKDDITNGLVISYMRANDSEIRTYLESEIYKKIKDAAVIKRFEDFKAGENAYADGKPAPQFTLTDINGKEVSLSDFKGKMLMMDCWATWCAPCIKGIPKFNKLREKYKGKNIEFVLVSVDENVALWKKKVKENKNNMYPGIQLNTSINNNTFKKDLMVQGIPRYILIGADGNIIRREAPHPGSEELYALINDNL